MNEFTAHGLPDWFRGKEPNFGIVLGSGLGGLTDGFENLETLPYEEIEGLPKGGVAGHAGCFVSGEFVGRKILAASGRCHLYEGFNARELCSQIRVMAAAGCKCVILTNAAGSLHLTNPPGTWMMIEDHLNLTGTSPLEGGPNFFDMSEVYSARLRDAFRHAAGSLDLVLGEGVYAGVRGPQYETPAEIHMLKTMGAAAVGMSTVLEAIQARALGMEVVGFSCLTNWAAGLSSSALNHEEVERTGEEAADGFVRLLARVLCEV